MLTLRENLLSRPWQERRYLNHRYKVETALPVIDNRPPQQRCHVACKLKRYQKEKERCSQIISDNFTLLQHLGSITKTTRVDNAWDEPPPNFLNRVGIYKIIENKEQVLSDEFNDNSDGPKSRKGRCLGCNPHKYVKKELIPEERVPFPPPKKRISKKPEEFLTEVSSKNSPSTSSHKEVKSTKPQTEDPRKALKRRSSQRVLRTRRAILRETQTLELSRGALTLKIRFPFDSGLIFRDRGQDKVIQREQCQCAALGRSTATRHSSGERR